MIFKAIVIASAALDHIAKMYPADDPKFTDIINSCWKTLDYLKQLNEMLEEEEHQQKSAIFPKKCPCPKCDPSEAEDVKGLNECIKDVVVAEIEGRTIPEVVYDAETGVDHTDTAIQSAEPAPGVYPHLETENVLTESGRA